MRRSDIKYDGYGRVMSYRDEVVEDYYEGGELVSHREVEVVRDDISYNGIGQEYSWVEVVSEVGGEVRTTERLITCYTDHGEVRYYEEDINSSVSGMKHKQFRNGEYNVFGQLESYEVLTSEGGDLVKSKYRLLDYDGSGRLRGYELEEVCDGERRVIIRSGIEYDEDGHVVGYKDEISSNGISEEVICRDIRYNVYGQVVSYVEDRVDGSGVKRHRVCREMEYYSDEVGDLGHVRGLLKGYVLEEDVGGVKYVTVRRLSLIHI